MSTPAPTSPPSPLTDATPPPTTTTPPPPAETPPPTTTPPSPPADTPPPTTTPTPPAADTPPPATGTPPPPDDTPPPTTTPQPPPPDDTPPPTTNPQPSPPADTPPPTTTPAPPDATPPAISPPAPPTNPATPPPSSGGGEIARPVAPPISGGNPPSPPSPQSGGARSPPPPRSVGGGGGGSPPATPSGGGSDGSSSSSPSDDGGGISTGVVVGIAVAGLVILALLSLVCVCCFKKKKKKRRNDGHYGPPPPKADAYGGQMQKHHWQLNPPPPADHVVNMPPKLTPPPGGAPRPPSPQPPPLAAPYISSGGSGSNYSGGEPLTPASPGMAFGIAKSSFSYDELAMATDGFSEANLLGQGGFGYVHRGVLSNGKEVAIKQLKAGSGQGEREFQAEVEIISRVHHKHLVSLVGYCITGSARMLVYEFVPNNTLEFHLHGKGRPTMDWGSRLKIALGSAKGLAYLHEDCHPKIIHRDIKAANILMDFNFEAKVADFGLARFSPELNTHVSTRVMGTFGYLAPEYAASGKLTDKSDVFSFGVVLLELITGRRPVDSSQTYMDDSLVDWARPLLTRSLEDNNFNALVDQRIQNEYSQSEMARMVACAAACVRHSARRRPRMSQVVRALEGDASLSDLNEGIKPGHSTVYGSYESSDYDAAQYNEDMIKFRKMALASQEYASSEYSGGAQTSEYGLNPSGSSSEGQTTRELTSREMEMAKVKRDSKGYSSGY